MTATAPGERLADHLFLTVRGTEGHDLRCACVFCQSSDAMRVHRDGGYGQCYSCGTKFSRLELTKKVLNGDEAGAWKLLVELGLEQPRNGHSHAAAARPHTNGQQRFYSPDERVAGVAEAKHVSADALRKYGATGGSKPCKYRSISIPAYAATGEHSGDLLINIDGDESERKGKWKKGAKHGLFLPHENGKPRLPAKGETWLLLEGPKDAARASMMGYLAAGMPTDHLSDKLAPAFARVKIILLPDLDQPSVKGTLKTGAALMAAGCGSIKLARLPGEITPSKGDDLRDVADRDEAAARAAIDGAERWDTEHPIYSCLPGEAAAEPFKIERLTSAELDAGDFAQAYIVDGVLPANQCGVVGGRFKTLKTTIAAELVISAGSGRPFLHEFAVPDPVPCIMLSCESGLPAIQSMARRICRAKGISLAELERVHWSSSLLQLTNDDHLAALGDFIADVDAKLLIIDPTYLVAGNVADAATNVFAMGQFFWRLTGLAQQTECSVVLVHHTKKGRPGDIDRFAPPELEELAMAGVCEWARFWILLSRRMEFDEERGLHRLWLSVGGSAGHAGLYGIDACEGRQSDECGRKWEVAVLPAAEIREAKEHAKEARKQTASDAKLEADRKTIVAAMVKFPEGETQRFFRDRTAMNPQRFSKVWATLVDDETIVEASEVKKGNRAYPAFQLRPDSDG